MMQEPKFTPGPWHAVRIDDNELAILDSTGSYVALADFPDLANNADKVDANARLIAAAPELYEALAEMFAALEPFTSKPIGAPDSPARIEQQAQSLAWIKARDALAKARGER